MNILILTKIKPLLLKGNVSDVYSYIENDYFFEGYYSGFKDLGHKVFLMPDESYFIPTKIKYFSPFTHRVIAYFLRKLKLHIIDRILLSKKVGLFCKDNSINFIFTEVNPYISPEVIKQYSPSTFVTQWYGIVPSISDTETMKMLPEYDFLWTPGVYNRDKVDFDGIDNAVYIGTAMNPKLLYHEYDSRFAYDVVFGGRLGREHMHRLPILEKLAQSFEDFAFYGYGAENIPLGYALKNKFKGWADAPTLRKIYSSSKIILNLTMDDYSIITKGFNARLFEIPQCNGGMQILPYDPKISDYFEVGKEVICFSDVDDLIEKIKLYLKDEQTRTVIANNAYLKSQKYTYFERAKAICEYIKKINNE